MVTGIAAAATVFGTVVVFFIRRVLPKTRMYLRFLDRVIGVPANPLTGEEEQLGLFPYLDRITRHLDGQDGEIARVERKLSAEVSGVKQGLHAARSDIGRLVEADEAQRKAIEENAAKLNQHIEQSQELLESTAPLLEMVRDLHRQYTATPTPEAKEEDS